MRESGRESWDAEEDGALCILGRKRRDIKVCVYEREWERELGCRGRRRAVYFRKNEVGFKGVCV